MHCRHYYAMDFSVTAPALLRSLVVQLNSKNIALKFAVLPVRLFVAQTFSLFTRPLVFNTSLTHMPMKDRLLLTNDDGIDAPGLAVLESVAATLGFETWIVAPEHDQSGTSHSISLHAPLRLTERGERRFGVSGTPGDCVVMAVRHLMADHPPALVLSGVNRGANIGVETVFSGTVGAAMTGMLFGIRSIALSQAFTDRSAVQWKTAETLAPAVLARLMKTDWPGHACLNVNFPDLPPDQVGEMMVTRQGRGLVKRIDVEPHRDPRGIAYHWLKFHREPMENAPDSETTALAQGNIAITPLQFERTATEAFESLQL